MTSHSLLTQAQALAPELTRIRRRLHQQPELAFAEYHTAAFVAHRLHELGIPCDTEVARTGVVGYLGNGSGPTIALRADMDALPIFEENDVPYRSQHEGVMHACGHDAHTAMLLGAAQLLKQHEGEIKGRVKLIFQPAEETIDAEGNSGATLMLAEGVIDDVDSIIGVHVEPALPAGQIGLRPGSMLAAADRFELEILGQAAHGAYAYQGVDAIVLAAQVITAAQTLVSRRIPAVQEGVVSFGVIQGGMRENVVCDRVLLVGTVRSFQPEIRDQLERELQQIASIARAMGGDYRLRYTRGTPSLVNDGQLTGFLSRIGRQCLGAEAVTEAAKSTGGEDFAWYGERTRSAFVRVGVRHPDWPARRPLHTPTFEIDERALPVGAALLAASALHWLAEYDPSHWQGQG